MKPTITLIAAMGQNRVIGRDNDLIWHLPRDLRHFKNKTKGHHIIMGRKTYESVGRPLPHRTNIIVTRDKNYRAEGCLIAHSLEAALKMVENDSTPYIAGGAEIYKQALSFADCLELTIVHQQFEGDAFFPQIDDDKWERVKHEYYEADEENPHAMEFMTLIRK